ncbi:hypothetical protein BX600DRAFT_505639 [Xylariales sp. PMI_506]|nr:hypothetical protein BX600DRAFT_505639 [Xylariales sp. PMI_506]
MDNYEARRRANIEKNAALIGDLGLQRPSLAPADTKEPPTKRRKVQQPTAPTRTSARLAEAPKRPLYRQDSSGESDKGAAGGKRAAAKRAARKQQAQTPREVDSDSPAPGLDEIRAGWTAWKSVAPPPERDSLGTLHFASHPEFTPNKSPEEIIREGSFGGSYWRPLYSKHLKTTVSNDWKELPSSWTEGLNVDLYLANPVYEAEVNKYGVACGQSIEEWEASGWIAHEYDVRGWFQWYCRFWMGRRCEDDERQISRWKRCVGPTGRWRRTLLKNYVKKGIRSVFDEGMETGGEVSPVVHQTCHHWAYEVRQEALDTFWIDGQ